MSSREDFQSFIPAKKQLTELTMKAMLVGAVLDNDTKFCWKCGKKME